MNQPKTNYESAKVRNYFDTIINHPLLFLRCH